MDNRKSYIYLEFYGFKSEPSVLTDSLQLIPYWSGKKGEPFQIPNKKPNPKRTYTENFWKYLITSQKEFDFEYLLKQLLNETSSRKEAIINLTKNNTGQILFVTYSNDTNPSYKISSENIKMISELNLQLYFDLYNLK